MKFSIGSCLQVDTSDEYHPITASSGVVYTCFSLIGLLHLYQFLRYSTVLCGFSSSVDLLWCSNLNTSCFCFGLCVSDHRAQVALGITVAVFWSVWHLISGFLAFYWIFMIVKSYTHPGFSHMSYGLLATVPHVFSLQAFGLLMAVDKIYNYNALVFCNGKGIFGNRGVLNIYSADNLFLDNYWGGKPYAACVNIPVIVCITLFQYIVCWWFGVILSAISFTAAYVYLYVLLGNPNATVPPTTA
jgi:hypothetical protein